MIFLFALQTSHKELISYKIKCELEIFKKFNQETKPVLKNGGALTLSKTEKIKQLGSTLLTLSEFITILTSLSHLVMILAMVG